MGLKDFLRENRDNIIVLDTMVFIYLFEENEKYINTVKVIFENVEGGRLRVVTSTITVVECLTKPLKKKDFPLVAKYKTAFRNFPNLSIIPVSVEVAERAASIRARYSLRTPDSIQIAAGIVERAVTFLTNDLDFKEIEGVRVIQLSDLTKD